LAAIKPSTSRAAIEERRYRPQTAIKNRKNASKIAVFEGSDQVSTGYSVEQRNNVLAGSASRQALLDKRRFEAIEKIWAAMNEHALKLKSISATVAMLKYEEVAKRAGDPRMQQMLSVFGTGVPKPNEMPEIPSAEQLFVPTLVWAYFNAYATILRTNVLIFRMAQNGIDRIDDLLSIENIRKALKAALPHQAKFIDENEVARYYYLLDEIESSLLTELQKVTEGRKPIKHQLRGRKKSMTL
jgi:hypothetical protein